MLGRRPQPGLRPQGCSSDLPGRPGSWSSPAVGFPQGTAFPEEFLRELGLDGRVWGQMWKECILLSWTLTGRRRISPRILEEKQKVQENNKCDGNTSLPPLKDVFLIGAKCLSQRQIENSVHFQHLLKTDFKTNCTLSGSKSTAVHAPGPPRNHWTKITTEGGECSQHQILTLKPQQSLHHGSNSTKTPDTCQRSQGKAQPGRVRNVPAQHLRTSRNRPEASAS